MMHQDMEHDVFRHPCCQVGDRNAHQRHLRQACIGHQRINAGSEIEDDAQVRKCCQFPRSGLPDCGIVHLGGIELRVGR